MALPPAGRVDIVELPARAAPDARAATSLVEARP
jgi:hypothetical protein